MDATSDAALYQQAAEDAQQLAMAMRAEVERLRGALAKAHGEVTALADALRAAGVRPTTVQAIIDGARPRASDTTALPPPPESGSPAP